MAMAEGLGARWRVETVTSGDWVMHYGLGLGNDWVLNDWRGLGNEWVLNDWWGLGN